jgi:hypothetical protein
MLLRPRLAVALFTLPLLMAGRSFAATDVPTAPFKFIHLRGGGHVVLQHGAVQRVTLVKGSTQFTTLEIRNGDQLEIITCNADCPHQYDLEIEISSPNIDGVAVAGGGKIDSRGDFPKQDKVGAAIAGGGSIDIRAMSADEVDAAVNGGGNIKTKPLHALHAVVNGGGEITYQGDPQVTSAVNGGGSVSKK